MSSITIISFHGNIFGANVIIKHNIEYVIYFTTQINQTIYLQINLFVLWIRENLKSN
jgi:hypothetical protein